MVRGWWLVTDGWSLSDYLIVVLKYWHALRFMLHKTRALTGGEIKSCNPDAIEPQTFNPQNRQLIREALIVKNLLRFGHCPNGP